MSNEQTKALARRLRDPSFNKWYFVGKGIDIGAGTDGLAQQQRWFGNIESVRDWDIGDGDAQYLAGIADNHFDFVHSSHCLEHMVDPAIAMRNWLRVLQPGGHLIALVPDEDMYEQGHWPSIYNTDHKWTFTIAKVKSWSPVSINLIDFCKQFGSIERIIVIRDNYRSIDRGDQTLGPAECAIEFIIKKLP